MFLSKLHWFILGLLAAPSPSSQLLRLRLEVDKVQRCMHDPIKGILVAFSNLIGAFPGVLFVHHKFPSWATLRCTMKIGIVIMV